MLIVSGSYQNYQNGAVSNQLTDGWKGGGERVKGDSESACVAELIHCTLYTRHNLYINLPPPEIVQELYNLYFFLILSDCTGKGQACYTSTSMHPTQILSTRKNIYFGVFTRDEHVTIHPLTPPPPPPRPPTGGGGGRMLKKIKPRGVWLSQATY